MEFTITAMDGYARCARIILSRGTVETPIFMPVATLGAIRALSLDRARAIGYGIILSNAYHLYLKPSDAVVAELGGLHRFINWEGNILTDSGGFQLFSLNALTKVTDEGIHFRSHIDGSAHHFSPERVMEIQKNLRSDIVMPLDHCTATDVGFREAQLAFRRTVEWLRQSVAYHRRDSTQRNQQLFGIVQGNLYPALRTQSAQRTIEFDLPGYAIGGLSVGEERNQFYDILTHTARILPTHRPRYLMGVGTPEYMLRAISEGIDMFDCVYPTRVARHGMALTYNGRLSMKKKRFHLDSRPLDSDCMCDTCTRYTRAYINHLCARREIMGALLLCEHNLFFMHQLCCDVRVAIKERRYSAFIAQFLSRYAENQH